MNYIDTRSRYTHYKTFPHIRGRVIRSIWAYYADKTTSYAYYTAGQVLLIDVSPPMQRIINRRYATYGVLPCHLKHLPGGRHAKR